MLESNPHLFLPLEFLGYIINQPSLPSIISTIIATTQETFGIQNPTPLEATILQDSIRSQGVSLDATVFSSVNEADTTGTSGHPVLGHNQSMSTDIPQNYLASQGTFF